ncbi:LysR family transcriptional regulator [Sphingomonas panaciterrae]|uniref:LysR family transcriptional regulator n=1 Tax=Sphingomonas panaciterrae TaxID=1462999 RepID=UPI002FF327F1
MRVRQIEVFHAVYVSGSISAAARTLQVSQPSVSKVLHHAEDQLGFKLFALVRGRLVPTDEGHALFREVDEAFERLRSLQQTAKNIRTHGGGHIRLAVVPSLGLSVAPRAIARFRARHRGVTFDVQTLHHDDLFRSLYERESDLAIAYNPPAHSRMTCIPLGQAELAVLFERKAFSAPGSRFPLSRLDGSDVIGLASSGPIGDLLDAELKRQNVVIREVVSAQTFYVAAALARYGAGVTIVDEFTARASVTLDMGFLPLEPAVRFNIGCVHLEDRPISAVSSEFVSHFKEALSDDRDVPAAA